MMISLITSLLLAVSAPPTCSGSASVGSYAMTYDAGRHQVVIFGGFGSDESLSAETWGWDGRTWQCIAPASPTGPSPREAAMLAYDERRHVLVLYGGRANRQQLRDTWELSASGWTRRNAFGPTPDPHGVAAYDASAGGVLLYHSLGDDTPTRLTWRWSDTSWIRVAEGPIAQFPNAMFASRGDRPAMLVTAKATGTRNAFNPLIYEWRNSRWTAMATTGSIPIFSPQARAARTTTGVLLYAGFEPDGRPVTTSILDGTTWRRYDGPSPSRRRNAQMVLDPDRSVVVPHAGYDGSRVLTDTWEWDGNGWRQIR